MTQMPYPTDQDRPQEAHDGEMFVQNPNQSYGAEGLDPNYREARQYGDYIVNKLRAPSASDGGYSRNESIQPLTTTTVDFNPIAAVKSIWGRGGTN